MSSLSSLLRIAHARLTSGSQLPLKKEFNQVTLEDVGETKSIHFMVFYEFENKVNKLHFSSL